MKSLEELEAALDKPDAGLLELEHANPKRRRDALDRVIRLGRRYAGLVKPLLARLEAEDNPFVLSRALSAVGAICPTGDGSAAGGAVARFLTHADARVTANAVDALRALADGAHREAVRGQLAHRAARVRANAAVYLAAFPAPDDRAVAAAVVALLSARDPLARRSGLWALAQAGAPPQWPAPADPIDLVQEAIRAADAETALCARALLERWASGGAPRAVSAHRALLEQASAGAGIEVGLGAAQRVPPLMKRAWAWLADSVLLGALALAALFALGRYGGQADERSMRVHTQLIMLAYSILFFMRDGLGGGRGLAKRYLGLRVIDRERSTGCGYVSSMIRQATFYLPLVNVCEVVWASIDPDGCRLVDRLLGTMVIDEKARELSRLDRALLVLFGLVFALGSGALFVMAMAGNLGLLRRWITW